MGLNVAAILLDHGRGLPGVATVPLRYDATQPVLLPEWQRGQRAPAVAAYAIDRLGPTATVQACFTATPELPRVVEVRALAEAPGGAPLPFAPLVGCLAPRRVSFDDRGVSAWQAFTFRTAAMAAGGVACATLQWRWQLRRGPADPWTDVDATQHRIYALLGQPTAPWLTQPAVPANPALPRTDLLDVACLWASGARDRAGVAARIAAAVNRLGGATLAYDAAVGAPHYTVLGLPHFLCDAFLDRVRGGEGAGPLVNCSDCATIVSTLANLLGADLWQSKMGLVGPGFRLNPLLAIGAREWSTLHGSFGFHEVAWTGACAADDLVYDACLRVDADMDPSARPRVPLLPLGMRFGQPGEGGFRDRIALAPDRAACEPQPELRVRRTVAAATPLPPPLPPPVARALSARAGEPAGRPDARCRFEGFRWAGGELGPEWLPVRSLSLDAAPMRLQMAAWRPLRAPQALLRADALETAGPEQARSALLEALGQVASPALDRWRADGGDDGDDGETRLALDNGALVLFTRGNLMVAVRSAGRQPLDVRAAARRIDRWLWLAAAPESPRTAG